MLSTHMYLTSPEILTGLDGRVLITNGMPCIKLDVGSSHESVAVDVVHPNPVSWTSIAENIRDVFISEEPFHSGSLPLVTYHDWVDILEQHVRNPTEETYNSSV